jgi:hypothetical protein
MKRWMSILFAILILSQFSGCYTLTKNHLKLIEDGKQPTIALIPFIPNQIFVEYYGTTVFANRSFRYDSSLDFEKVITDKAIEVVSREGRVNLYVPEPDELRKLVNQLTHEKRYYWWNLFSDEDKRIISAWGKEKGVEFVAFVNPGSIPVSQYGDSIVTEKGIIAGHTGQHNRFCMYSIRVIDVKHAEFADIVSEMTATLKNSPFRKELTQDQIEKVTADWKFENLRDENHGLTSNTLEWELELASYYHGDDYGTLTGEEIKQLDNFFLPHVEKTIHKLMVKLSFVND